jgi:hypothetical protein
MRASLVLVLVTVVVVVAVTAGCDLFGIRCNADADCPSEQPFCVLGLCNVEDGPLRAEGEGEGGDEGEGEGACDSDADCGGGLCYDAVDDGEPHFVAERVGTCVPGPDEDVSCSEATLFDGRQSGGEVIFDATATRSSGSCTSGETALSINVLSFDREGDAFFGEGSIFVVPEGGSSPATQPASVSGESGKQTMEYFGFGGGCFPESAGYVAIAVGVTSPTSNALCVPITAAP